MPLVVTLVRHGESEDNPKSIWAGWKDAPLSPLGEEQAAAVGAYFSATSFRAIYASPLLRAFQTGKAIHSAQKTSPLPPFITSPNLREQHFGIAEGYPWTYSRPKDKSLEQLYAKKIFPVLAGRDEAFPEGESPNDVARRAEAAVKECVVPNLKEYVKGVRDGSWEEEEEYHIGIASHGLCMSELIPAILRLDTSFGREKEDRSYTGHLNTAWSRIVVTLDRNGAAKHADDIPSVKVEVTNFNVSDHLHVLSNKDRPQDDDANSEARAFFGGAAITRK